MRVLISGASGMIGTALTTALRNSGDEVRRLVRRTPQTAEEIAWDPAAGQLDPKVFDGVDAVVNLSGSLVIQPPRRWTRAFIEELYSSRLESTRTLVEAMQKADTPPPVFVSQSGKDFYGEGGEFDESSAQDHGTVLSDLCGQWEDAASQAPAETQTSFLRTGIVLGPKGGALGKLLIPLRLGVGGRLGSGKQFWPWIALPDHIAAIQFLLKNPVHGPVNMGAPQNATVSEIVSELGRALHRPTVIPVPSFLLKIGLGRAAEEVLLGSTTMRPGVLLTQGFEFKYPDLASAAAWVAEEIRHS
ncbi:TIGR01777 family oxidoreductase [Renibacterium salmoninarum]|nr:TIGR01777 family oxidoreductase [Renibacterium salmoninarum]